MKILAIDTAAQTGSVALLHGQTLVAESLVNVQATHSELLLDQIDQALRLAGLVLSDLDLIAAVRGPGSFTGLRIGLATANGLAQALGLKLIGVSSLQLLAMNLPLCPVPICTFLDARKKEVYTAMFQWIDGRPQAIGPEQVLPPEVALRQISGPVALVGDGVLPYRFLIDEILGPRASLPALCHHQPRAGAAATLAALICHQKNQSYSTALAPVYIRPSDAEINAVNCR
jgi:tRNA threonylcarbamoyladenosine biosynthesis protein TsaB